MRGDFKKLVALLMDDHTVNDEYIKKAIENQEKEAKKLLIISLVTLAVTVIAIIALKYFNN